MPHYVLRAQPFDRRAPIRASRGVGVGGGGSALYTQDFSAANPADTTAHQYAALTVGGIGPVSESYTDFTTAIAHGGTTCVRFRMGESEAAGNHNSELRFGTLPSLTEVYIQWYEYWPDGTEGLGPKSKVMGTLNDKRFRIWGPTDAAYGSLPSNKMGFSLFGPGGGGDGALGLEYMYSGDPAAQWAEGLGPTPLTKVPILIDANRGRWVRHGVHAKVGTAQTADAVLQYYVDGVLLMGSTSLKAYWGSSTNTFTHFYLNGYANNGYPSGQFSYVDDLTVTTGGFP